MKNLEKGVQALTTLLHKYGFTSKVVEVKTPIGPRQEITAQKDGKCIIAAPSLSKEGCYKISSFDMTVKKWTAMCREEIKQWGPAEAAFRLGWDYGSVVMPMHETAEKLWDIELRLKSI